MPHQEDGSPIARFNRLLKAMAQGEPHKAEKKAAQRGQASEPPKDSNRQG